VPRAKLCTYAESPPKSSPDPPSIVEVFTLGAPVELRRSRCAVRHSERRLCGEHFEFRTDTPTVVDNFQGASAEHGRDVFRYCAMRMSERER
jgi:hypothetical protein